MKRSLLGTVNLGFYAAVLSLVATRMTTTTISCFLVLLVHGRVLLGSVAGAASESVVVFVGRRAIPPLSAFPAGGVHLSNLHPPLSPSLRRHGEQMGTHSRK